MSDAPQFYEITVTQQRDGDTPMYHLQRVSREIVEREAHLGLVFTHMAQQMDRGTLDAYGFVLPDRVWTCRPGRFL